MGPEAESRWLPSWHDRGRGGPAATCRTRSWLCPVGALGEALGVERTPAPRLEWVF